MASVPSSMAFVNHGVVRAVSRRLLPESMTPIPWCSWNSFFTDEWHSRISEGLEERCRMASTSHLSVCQPSGHCYGNWFKSLQSFRASTAHFLSRCQRRASTAHFLSRGEGVPVRPDSASSNGSVNLLFFSGGFFSYFRQSSWPWVTRITCRLHSFLCQIIYGTEVHCIHAGN